MEAIFAFLFSLVGNDVSNLKYLLIPFTLILVIFVIITFEVSNGFSLFLVIPIIMIFSAFDNYVAEYTLKIAETENQSYVNSYIDSIKQETAAGKNIIVVDSQVVGRNGRKYLIEFEKDMVDKNYKVQSNNDGIVVYRKFAKE